ncbi:MAG: amidohydrolase [Bacillota bacterium]
MTQARPDLVLANARVVRKDGNVEGPADIFIADGIITGVVGHRDASTGGGAEGKEELGGAEMVDCTGCYVSPGLVNMHTHSPMTLFRGLAEDVRIEDWFNRRIWPYESHLSRDDAVAGALLAVAEMIDAGVTAFFDHYFFAEEIVAVARDTGMRADIAPTIFGLTPDWEDALDRAVNLVEETRSEAEESMVRVRIGPHAPYTCPPRVLKECAKRAKDVGVGVHIHVSETEEQVRQSLKEHGKTPFELLADAGVLDVPVIVAHGVWISERELPLVPDHVWFAACPKTYMKLASGVGHIFNVAKSLRVGIGTDGAASSNTLSPLEQARLFALLGKHCTQDATRFDLRAIWRMLMQGHEALGQRTGDVAPEYEADLVVWDLAYPGSWPVHDPLASIIYSADSRNIRDVLVGGRFLKRGGVILAVDTRETLARAERHKQRLLSRGPGTAQIRY